MRSILSGLSGGRRRSPDERRRLVELARQMYWTTQPDDLVIAGLEQAGASAIEAQQIAAEAATGVDDEIVRTVALPASSKLDLNYYFLLGVSPRAGADRIRRAFRRKAREAHPDVHAQDFTAGQWNKLMTVLSDANTVLTDPSRRRAYDIVWRRRSQALALRHRRPGERRGDWETRYLWEIADVAEREDALVALMEELAQATRDGRSRQAVLTALRRAVELYEGALIEIRTQTRALPDHLMFFSERARVEMQRKELLVRSLRQLLPAAREANTAAELTDLSTRIESTLEILDRIRDAHHYFDLVHARPYL